MELWVDIQQWIGGTLVAPALYQLGLMAFLDDSFAWVEFIMLGLVLVAVTWAICRPLEAWRPVETWSDRGPVRTDVVYTLLNKLGILPLIVFVLLTPLAWELEGWLRFQGLSPPTLERLVPFLDGRPFLTFVAYVLILDCADYWRHRLQHRWAWWWSLHSLHHAQRQMTFWTDDRNHVVDDIIAAAWTGAIALLIGVPPSQFPLILLAFKFIESFSHVNARIGFGAVFSYVLVSPHYHRMHHAVEHAEPPYDRYYGCNFSAVFPIWDVLFGTARIRGPWGRTGDLTSNEAAANGGWWRTQWEGLARLGRTLGGYVLRRRRAAA